jgi:peptidoglycan/LPS O-acetylase OafA/YrhL
MPLLHTWTLSVEEQFYLIWPLVLASTAFIGLILRSNASTLISFLLAITFFVSILLSWWGTQVKPVAAFYLMPTRAWEFVLGSSLAIFGQSLANRLSFAAGVVSAGGLLAVLISIVTFNQEIAYPGLAAVVPTLGASAIVVTTLGVPTPPTIKLLQNRSMVAVGALSYSWYLWHWPLLALVRVHDMGTKNLSRDLLVVSVALILAIFTYALLENPIRRRKPWPFSGTGDTLASGGIMSCIIGGLALGLYLRADKLAFHNADLAGIYSALPSHPNCLALVISSLGSLVCSQRIRVSLAGLGIGKKFLFGAILMLSISSQWSAPTVLKTDILRLRVRWGGVLPF